MSSLTSRLIMTQDFPSHFNPVPLPPPSHRWTLLSYYGHRTISEGKGHAKGLGSLLSCPLNVFTTSLPVPLSRLHTLFRADSWVQLWVLLCSFKGIGTQEHLRSRWGAGGAGGSACRHCQEPSEAEAPPGIWAGEQTERPGHGRLGGERKGCGRRQRRGQLPTGATGTYFQLKDAASLCL